MSAEVVSLNGEPVSIENEADGSVVEELERLLEAARAGEITGLAGAFVHHNGVVSYAFAGRVGGYAHIGGLEVLKERLMRLALNRGDRR